MPSDAVFTVAAAHVFMLLRFTTARVMLPHHFMAEPLFPDTLLLTAGEEGFGYDLVTDKINLIPFIKPTPERVIVPAFSF